MKKFPIALIVATCMVMSACSNPEEEAKKLGFSNVAEMKDIQGKGFKTMAEYELDQKKQIEKRKADALKFAIDSIEGDIKAATTVEAVSALRNFMSRFDVFKDPVNKDAVEELKNKLYEKQDNIGAILFYKKIGIKDFGYCRAANNWSLNHPFEFLGQMTVGGKTLAMKDRLDLVENLIEKEGISKIEISKFIDAGDSIILRDAYGGVSRELVYGSAHTDCIKLMESIYGNNYK